MISSGSTWKHSFKESISLQGLKEKTTRNFFISIFSWPIHLFEKNTLTLVLPSARIEKDGSFIFFIFYQIIAAGYLMLLLVFSYVVFFCEEKKTKITIFAMIDNRKWSKNVHMLFHFFLLLIIFSNTRFSHYLSSC